MAACAQPTHGAGAKPDGFRLVTGSLDASAAAQLGRQTTGVQIAAVAVGVKEAPARVDLFTSGIFDASRPDTASFTMAVDGTRSFDVVLQVPSGSGTGVGTWIATLSFSDGRGGSTTLVPPGTDDIALGALALSGTDLVVGDADDPLGQIDTDADGAVDLTDGDDDADGTPDDSDPDVGGDGVDDTQQVLVDADGDGVPDILAP